MFKNAKQIGEHPLSTINCTDGDITETKICIFLKTRYNVWLMKLRPIVPGQPELNLRSQFPKKGFVFIWNIYKGIFLVNPEWTV
jgi:hypothetical protein